MKNGLLLEFIKDDTKKTTEIYLEAVKENGLAIQYINRKMRTPDIYRISIERNIEVLTFLSQDECTNGRSIHLVKKIFELYAKEDIIENINNNIINVDMGVKYYSSLNLPADCDYNTFFKNKYICWMSDRFDQSILHLFNGYRDIKHPGDIQPIICRFSFNKPIRVINSFTTDNINIFDGILKEKINKYINRIIQDSCDRATEEREFIRKSRISNNEGNLTKITFTQENNKYILSIIKELNNFLPREQHIYGYKNDFDQKEIALINFNEFVTDLNISKITEISKDAISFKFPLLNTEYIKIQKSIRSLYGDQTEFPEVTEKILKKRMFLISDISIKYENFDNNRIIEEYKKEDINLYFKGGYYLKYLKYKAKYLQLKKFLI